MAVVDAMRQRGVRRLIHVSSLSAREPGLSDYGWSKELAERHVKASGLDWTIIRPPAIYGPGDREMLELFRMAKRGFMLMPPGGRLSVRSEEHTSELQSLMRISYAVFCLKKKNTTRTNSIRARTRKRPYV